MNKEEMCFISACDMAEKIKNQELTSSEITEAIIERIKKINPIVNAYCTPTFELAREMAKKSDEAIKKGEKLGKLHGIPISIKDLIETKGIRTTYGSLIYEHYVPDVDEIVVKRLKDAGCVILGKTNTPEIGHKTATDNFIFGETVNPWDLKKTCGGSSGGAAVAVATGMSPLALGSDGGGSIRIPASFCGVYGLKPTFGRIPRIFKNMAYSIFSHYGPLTRFVKDAALMLDAMAGPYPADKYSIPQKNPNFLKNLEEEPNNLKIGYSLDLNVKACDEEVEKSILDAVQKFQAFEWCSSLEKVKIILKKALIALSTNVAAAMYYDYKPFIDQWREKMAPELVRMIDAGMELKAFDLFRAESYAKEINNTINQYFKKYDILITPTTPIPAIELGIPYPSKIAGKSTPPTGLMGFCYPFNITWNPAASIPCGWTSHGLPIGMQIIGKRLDEITILQVSKAFEDLQPWQNKKPRFN
ncbi:MAG: amidase [Promethearchaeota archaeon]